MYNNVDQAKWCPKMSRFVHNLKFSVYSHRVKKQKKKETFKKLKLEIFENNFNVLIDYENSCQLIKKCTTNHMIVAALLYYRATIVFSSLSLLQYLSLPQKVGGVRGKGEQK